MSRVILFYRCLLLLQQEFRQKQQRSSISAGINLSNIGGKISYDDGQNKEFLPANFRLGTTYSKEFDSFNSLAISFDINKLMVPTPQITSGNLNTTGGIVLPDNSSNMSVISSIFSSFTDAPGAEGRVTGDQFFYRWC